MPLRTKNTKRVVESAAKTECSEKRGIVEQDFTQEGETQTREIVSY